MLHLPNPKPKATDLGMDASLLASGRAIGQMNKQKGEFGFIVPEVCTFVSPVSLQYAHFLGYRQAYEVLCKAQGAGLRR